MRVVIKKCNGEFMAALAMKLAPVKSALLADTLAAKEIVVMASHAIHTHVEFEGDASMVIKALQHEGLDDNSPFGHIITDT